MRRIIIYFSFSILLTIQSPATIHNVTASGFDFVPNSISISLGDTINFSLGPSHNAREVTADTWNSNGITSNGGFEVPLGGGIYVPTETRTYYYVCVPHAELGMKGIITVNSVTGITENAEIRPDNFMLWQNYPNPFNPTTELSFTIRQSSFVSLKIFDLSGREVAALVNEARQPGTYTTQWNAENMASGVYNSVLTAGAAIQTRKMLLLR